MHRTATRGPAGRATRATALAAAACLAAACAGLSSPPAVAPPPAEVPALESHMAGHPGDTEAAVRLAAAYRAAGRLDDARVLMERAVANAPRDAGAVLMLGVVYEEMERYDDARELYARYGDVGTDRLRRAVRARTALLDRLELRKSARDALAREAELTAGAPPAAGTVAVFPFLYGGEDARLAPLSRALAEMLATDLAQTDRLTVLERARVQALLDEAALAGTGLVESSTAVRAGRLLRAGSVVQGRVGGSEAALRMEALVAGAGDGRGPTVSQEAEARRLFDAEKELALGIYRALGIELTPAERERVSRRWTENVQALLVFGVALEAEDAGDYARAAEEFRRAAELDPNFAEAAERAEDAEDLAAAAAVTTEALAIAALGEPSFLDLAALAQLPLARDPASEALGSEGIARPRTTIDIIIRRP